MARYVNEQRLKAVANQRRMSRSPTSEKEIRGCSEDDYQTPTDTESGGSDPFSDSDSDWSLAEAGSEAGSEAEEIDYEITQLYARETADPLPLKAGEWQGDVPAEQPAEEGRVDRAVPASDGSLAGGLSADDSSPDVRSEIGDCVEAVEEPASPPPPHAKLVVTKAQIQQERRRQQKLMQKARDSGVVFACDG